MYISVTHSLTTKRYEITMIKNHTNPQCKTHLEDNVLIIGTNVPYKHISTYVHIIDYKKRKPKNGLRKHSQNEESRKRKIYIKRNGKEMITPVLMLTVTEPMTLYNFST